MYSINNYLYKNRNKIEHHYGIIKRAPKINCVYEKTQKSYNGIVLMVYAIININRTNKLR